MGNMSYCKFRNTLEDLQDCYDNWDDIESHQTSELLAREDLYNLCVDIVKEFEGEQDDN